MNKAYNVTDAVRRLSKPSVETDRLLNRLIGEGGSVKYDGSSWMHFASQPLLAADVIESVDGSFMPGLQFEDYLIEKNLRDLHSRYVQADRFGKSTDESKQVELSLESFTNSLEACKTSAAKLALAVEWVGALVGQVESLTEAVEGLIDREFGDAEQ
jgi:hypothetical protein